MLDSFWDWRSDHNVVAMYWLPGFVQCLKDSGPARCWAQQISCSAGLDSSLALEKFLHHYTYILWGFVVRDNGVLQWLLMPDEMADETHL